MRKSNIKSDYAARGPSLAGLAIILKSNVLLLFPPHLASLELFRIICWFDKESMCDGLFEKADAGHIWARAVKEKEIELEFNFFFLRGDLQTWNSRVRFWCLVFQRKQGKLPTINSMNFGTKRKKFMMLTIWTNNLVSALCCRACFVDGVIMALKAKQDLRNWIWR